MTLFDFSSCTNVYFVGDIHGEYNILHNEIKNKIRNANLPTYKKRKLTELKDKSIIIVLGDVGLGFNKFEFYMTSFKPLNTTLSEHDIHLILMRGNHDNPKYFTEDLFKFSNIHTVPDYSVIKTATHNVLCVGGATSTDRSWRLNRENIINRYRGQEIRKEMWWKDETFIFNQNEIDEIKNKNIPIDILATHLPSNHPNIYKRDSDIEYWSSVDEKLKDDLTLENSNIDKLQESLKDFNIICWASGHTHLHNRFIDNNISYLQYGNNYNITSVDEEIQSLQEVKEAQSKVKVSGLPHFTATYSNTSLADLLRAEAPHEVEPIAFEEPMDLVEDTDEDTTDDELDDIFYDIENNGLTTRITIDNPF